MIIQSPDKTKQVLGALGRNPVTAAITKAVIVAIATIHRR